MDIDGAVAKEASQTGRGRGVKVRVSEIFFISVLAEDEPPGVQQDLLSCKWAHGDVAMLAGEISNLAGLWLGVVARRNLATDIRIKMAQSFGTVTIGWDWLVVNMVHYASIVRK